MRIGIVTKWFPSGQGVVSRQLRAALDELGHETFVLARPGKGPRAARRSGGADSDTREWSRVGLTEATTHAIPAAEYLAWARANGLDVVFCDENYDFEELGALRRDGVRLIGRFVWESFAPADAPGAAATYDVVYSLTRCEQRRYLELGIESPYVRWGVHPELLGRELARRDDGLVRLFFPCSFMSPRRPVAEVLKAFRRVEADELRLTISAQVPRRAEQLQRAARRDPRIELVLDELPYEDYLALFASHDALLGPSRWEGLGVPLYEATALGLPVVTNDDPPMNELVADGVNGLLVASTAGGTTKSGVEIRDPDVDSLASAISRIADPALRAGLAAGARRARADRPWSNTVADLAELLASLDA